MEKTRRGNIKKGKGGNQIKTKQPRKKGRVIEDFLKKHGLSHHNSPAEFFSRFILFNSNGYSNHQNVQDNFDLFAKYTNLNASLSGASEGGSCYKNWKPFSASELRQHFA